MKPFPKIVGALVAIAGAVVALQPGILAAVAGEKIAGGVIAVCLLIVSLSHSLPGTGGKDA
jgi:hypothetical protein